MVCTKELNGYSSVIGGGGGLGLIFGVEAIHIGRLDDLDDDIHGCAISPGVSGLGCGIDLHCLETYSEEIRSGRITDLPNDLPGLIYQQNESWVNSFNVMSPYYQ